MAGNGGETGSRQPAGSVDPFWLAAERIVALSKVEPRRLSWYFSVQALAPDRQKPWRSVYRLSSGVEIFVLLRALVALKHYETSNRDAARQAIRVEVSAFYDGSIEPVLGALEFAGLVTADFSIDPLILRVIDHAEEEGEHPGAKGGLLGLGQDRYGVVSEVRQEQTRLAKQYSELTERKVPSGLGTVEQQRVLEELEFEKARVATELGELDRLMVYQYFRSDGPTYIEPEPISTENDALKFNPLKPWSRAPKWLNRLLVGLGRRSANELPLLVDDYAVGMHSASIDLDEVLNLLGPPPDSAGTYADPAPRVPAGVS